MRAGGVLMVLGPFAETKGSRLPGRNPANAVWLVLFFWGLQKS